MPIFEYKCSRCKEVQEIFCWSTAIVDRHPCSCGGEGVRIISAPGGIKVGLTRMSVMRGWEPTKKSGVRGTSNEGDYNYWQSLKLAEQLDCYKKPKCREDAVHEKQVVKKAKELGWD